MKKIILACFIMLFAGSALFAQQTQTAKPAQEKTKTVKKDGTPDKRYKKPSQHVKKDGTADKRFKENKQ